MKKTVLQQLIREEVRKVLKEAISIDSANFSNLAKVIKKLRDDNATQQDLAKELGVIGKQLGLPEDIEKESDLINKLESDINTDDFGIGDAIDVVKDWFLDNFINAKTSTRNIAENPKNTITEAEVRSLWASLNTVDFIQNNRTLKGVNNLSIEDLAKVFKLQDAKFYFQKTQTTGKPKTEFIYSKSGNVIINVGMPFGDSGSPSIIIKSDSQSKINQLKKLFFESKFYDEEQNQKNADGKISSINANAKTMMSYMLNAVPKDKLNAVLDKLYASWTKLNVDSKLNKYNFDPTKYAVEFNTKYKETHK